ncbi:magnesium transporter [Maritimibacter sp. 55A14]|uniref:magnesium transporter n=1 Tax=Maritimibacter sp. 55A14 TaxID=2174844 RepID=UPI000D608DB6|nr:magnesium transporter [Maritimibacter sp. 55A14]PWE28882.1 magnesium transporter [Maritimibacter sp. 55A14]
MTEEPLDQETQADEDGYADDAYVLDNRKVDQILEAVENADLEGLTELLEPFHAADIADLLEQIGSSERRELLALWPTAIDGEVLSDLDESLREEVIEYLPPDVLSAAVRGLESDDVVDLVEDLEAPQQGIILGALEEADRVAVEQALSYPEDTAGRLMQRELVMAPTFWTVGDAIDYMRAQEKLPERFYHVMMVDPRQRVLGQVSLGQLMASPRATPLSEIMDEDFRTIPVTQSTEDVAYAFNQYHLISAPVVDAEERLVGVITIDDAMIVLDEEAEEDILRLAGVGDSSLSDRVWETARGRFTWLFVNLITAILASVVIAQFEDTIAVFVALAVLMPIVASMGGNAGTQSMTVAVRALATKDLTGSNLWRVVRREAVVGLLNGGAFAMIMAVVAVLWFGQPMLGVVIALAMVMTLVAAALGGIVIPILLDRFGIDPALASGPFVTTVTDVVGFFAFLGLAAVILL